MSTITEAFYVLSECYDPPDAPYHEDCFEWIENGQPPLDERGNPVYPDRVILAGPFNTRTDALKWLQNWWAGQGK